MNSEELELSLRSEFDNYIKNVLEDIKRDVAEFQKNFEHEFEKHKAQLDAAFDGLSNRFANETVLDKGFLESVSEHLRLARDEGALITANAFSEAEKLAEESAKPPHLDILRDALDDISRKSSQSEILRTLIEYAAKFTPRGAFFIVKNERFVGWKVFGSESGSDVSVREVNFPVADNTVLADAANSLLTKEAAYGAYADDEQFLEPLGFGRPDKMFAIPLIARGRGVAVLYADYGKEGVTLHAEALEMLVRVAGLTVELLAASQGAVPARTETVEHQYAAAPAVETAAANAFESPAEPEPVYEDSFTDADEPADAAYEPAESSYDAAASEDEPVESAETEETPAAEYAFESFTPSDNGSYAADDATVEYEIVESSTDTGSVPEQVETSSDVESFVANAEASVAAAGYTAEPEFETADVGETVEEPVSEDVEEPQAVPEFAAAAEPVVETAAASSRRSRFAERNVDLPIEVDEADRSQHNSARRFARLLVSEINLYNAEKVVEGRHAGDLYDRLREAIDRSREMYDKRVKPPVADRFDYFHYELVNSLAEGDESKLGASYKAAVSN